MTKKKKYFVPMFSTDPKNFTKKELKESYKCYKRNSEIPL
jgi:hypothetical protein